MIKSITKEELLKKLQELLKTKEGLDFLLELKKQELEKIVALVRDRVENS